MKRLAIVIADHNIERLRTALVMAAGYVALGGQAHVFLQGSAVAMLRAPVADPDADRQTAAGLPTLAQLLDEAIGLGIVFSACQSSLALLGLNAADFDAWIDWGGMIRFLSVMGPVDQLIVI